MKRITIPENLKGKELYKFLIENKSALIAQKKSAIKHSEPVSFNPQIIYNKPQDIKAGGAAPELLNDTGVLRVKVVANTAMWMDSQRDVLLRDNAKKSIRERKGLIPHIIDHNWSALSEIGDVVNIYYQDVNLTDLGVNKAGTAQALIFETDIRKEYNEGAYKKYLRGKAKQHSIGLQYLHIELAINDQDYEKEMDFYNKYINEIINKDAAEEDGFFWIVSEIRLIENSLVLFGSNELTPTLPNNKSEDTTEEPPIISTPEEPEVKAIDYGRIAELFLN